MNYWVPHGFEYGCVEFEGDSSTCSSPGAKFGANQKEKNNRYLPKITMLFGVVPSAKNNDYGQAAPSTIAIHLFFEPSTISAMYTGGKMGANCDCLCARSFVLRSYGQWQFL
jgi:hypothetical protein